jgi:hypothetical protein
VPKNVRLVSIHDVLTSREARSDPTASRAQIKGEPLPEPLSGSHAKQEQTENTKSPLHSWELSGSPAPEANEPLRGWRISDRRAKAHVDPNQD